MLEQRQLLSGLSGSIVQDQLTAYNSVNQMVTTAPAQYGPEQFAFAGGQFVRELTQPDGTRIATGYASGNFALSKYNADGSLDTSFGGGDGKATVDFGTPSDQLLNANLRPDGKILLFGLSNASGSYQVVLSRLNSDGTFDATFGDNGKLFTGVAKNQGFGIVTSVLGRLKGT